STLGFAGQLSLGRYRYCRAHPPLQIHRHQGCMEICFLDRGMQVYEVDGRRYVMTGSDVFLTFPDEEHSSGGFPEDRGILYWMLICMPKADEPFLAFSADRVRPLIDGLHHLDKRYFRGTRVLHDLLEEIIAAAIDSSSPDSYGAAGSPGSLAPLIVSTKVAEFLLEVLRCAAVPAEACRPDDVKNILNYIEESRDRLISINELASVADLSVSRFKAKFKQVVGIPPAEYILRRKIDLAGKMLTDSNESITCIAHSLGFSSSQYFSTVFRRFTNLQPGEYRKRFL
ncbi:MAG: AraC family transcriptional regulator, partial [bacterium]|nr:AraC family transcriptional regulator [bacterium]